MLLWRHLPRLHSLYAHTRLLWLHLCGCTYYGCTYYGCTYYGCTCYGCCPLPRPLTIAVYLAWFYGYTYLLLPCTYPALTLRKMRSLLREAIEAQGSEHNWQRITDPNPKP